MLAGMVSTAWHNAQPTVKEECVMLRLPMETVGETAGLGTLVTTAVCIFYPVTLLINRRVCASVN